MAEIKVKRTGLPSWLLLLLGLLAAALLWFFLARGGDGGGELADVDGGATGLRGARSAAPPTELPAGPAGGAAPAAGEPITGLATILDADDPRALAGREVRLDDIPVPQMLGDATFWVAGSSGERVLVILDQEIPAPPAHVEGRVNVNAGQRVQVQGVLRRADDAPGKEVLNADDRAALRDQQVYIWARSAQVVSPAEFAPAGPPGRVSN